MLGVDHDKIILLSTPFPTIPMLGADVGVMLLCSMLEINDVVLCCVVLCCVVLCCVVLCCVVLCCVVLCCVVLCCIVLYCIVLYTLRSLSRMVRTSWPRWCWRASR